MELCAVVWDLSHMTKKKPMDPFAQQILDLLEAARPYVEGSKKRLSDNKWCEMAGVNTGFWRDLRNGSEPGVVRLQRLADIAQIKLSTLIAAAENPPFQLPSEDRLTEMMAGLLEGVGLEDVAAEHAKTLAERLPDALEQVSGPLAPPAFFPTTIPADIARPRAKRDHETKQ